MSLPAFPPHLTQMSEFIGQSILEKQRSDSSLIPFPAPTDKELQGEKIAAALGAEYFFGFRFEDGKKVRFFKSNNELVK